MLELVQGGGQVCPAFCGLYYTPEYPEFEEDTDKMNKDRVFSTVDMAKVLEEIQTQTEKNKA